MMFIDFVLPKKKKKFLVYTNRGGVEKSDEGNGMQDFMQQTRFVLKKETYFFIDGPFCDPEMYTIKTMKEREGREGGVKVIYRTSSSSSLPPISISSSSSS
jgi:hypothetical protein